MLHEPGDFWRCTCPSPGENTVLLRALELEENSERIDLDSFEASKQRTAEIEAAEEEAEANCAEPAQKGGRGKKGGRRAAARSAGVSETEARRVEKHVSLAEQFPTMQGKDWLKTHVLTAGEILEKVPEAERPKLGALVLQPGVPRKQALAALENVVEMLASKRKQFYGMRE